MLLAKRNLIGLSRVPHHKTKAFQGPTKALEVEAATCDKADF